MKVTWHDWWPVMPGKWIESGVFVSVWYLYGKILVFDTEKHRIWHCQGLLEGLEYLYKKIERGDTEKLKFEYLAQQFFCIDTLARKIGKKALKSEEKSIWGTKKSV